MRYINNSSGYKPSYKLVEIFKNEDDEYIVHIQIINKKLVFYTKPQEILMDDEFVDQFSPRDIRTLTYLGYLSLNKPEYSITAQRVIESNKILFAIKHNPKDKIIIKTANQIINEQDIISRMSPTDAVKIGYALGSNDFN